MEVPWYIWSVRFGFKITFLIENSWQHDVLSTNFHWQVRCLYYQYILFGSINNNIFTKWAIKVFRYDKICNIYRLCFYFNRQFCENIFFINQYMLVTSFRAIAGILTCQRDIMISSLHPSHCAQRPCASGAFSSFD